MPGTTPPPDSFKDAVETLDKAEQGLIHVKGLLGTVAKLEKKMAEDVKFRPRSPCFSPYSLAVSRAIGVLGEAQASLTDICTAGENLCDAAGIDRVALRTIGSGGQKD